MRTWIVVDIDGTMSDCSARIDYAKMGMWDDFHSRCLDDPPFPDVVGLIRVLSLNHGILAVTGRNSKYRNHTFKWMNQHEVQVHGLLMRPDMDYSSDPDLKLQLLEKKFGSKQAVLDQVAFCLEDRDKVVEAYRNYGLNCWQVREGTY